MNGQELSVGRTKNIGEPMALDDAKRTIAVLRTYRSQGDKPLSYEAICNQISEWYIKDPDNASRFQPFTKEELNFVIPQSTMARIVGEDQIPSNQTMKAIYLWIMSIEFCKLEYEKRKYEDDLISKEGLVLSVRRTFGFFSEMRTVKAGPWSGDFALYRPYHLDPRKRAQVNIFTIGSEKSEFDCNLVSQYPDLVGIEETNTGRGKLIPLDKTHAVAMMAMNMGFIAGIPNGQQPDGHYTLHLSDPQIAGQINGFRGVMVASMGENPSAWPIYAVRLMPGQEITPHVLEPEEYRALPPIVRKQLDRGSVYWNQDDFPKTLSRGYAKPAP